MAPRVFSKRSKTASRSKAKSRGVNKGGLDVEMGGVRAFCPSSQAGGRGEDVSLLVGQTLRFLVTDVRDGGRNVVVSRRQLQEREVP